MSGAPFCDTEWGLVFKNRKDYVLSDILLTIATC